MWRAIVAAALFFAATGCVRSMESLRVLTASYLNCTAEEVEIISHQTSPGRETWIAEYLDRRYTCVDDQRLGFICKEQ